MNSNWKIFRSPAVSFLGFLSFFLAFSLLRFLDQQYDFQLLRTWGFVFFIRHVLIFTLFPTLLDCFVQGHTHRINVLYIYLHGWLIFMVNVDRYTIHWSYGIWIVLLSTTLRLSLHVWNATALLIKKSCNSWYWVLPIAINLPHQQCI